MACTNDHHIHGISTLHGRFLYDRRVWRLGYWTLLLGCFLPFVGKPVHLDDTNFLALARGARADLWRPHAIAINWQGRTESAFDVLSNPPGIGWWLAPWVEAGPVVQHLAMLPWLLLAGWGALRLAARFSPHREAAAILLVLAPVGMLASHSLMPDLPLLACTLAGLGGLVGGGGAGFALLLGCGALFRYSGLALLPLVFLWAWLAGHPRRARHHTAIAALPILLLALHDLHAYGQIHLLAMVGFQSASEVAQPFWQQGAAILGMLGGAVLPILCWGRMRPALIGAGLGLGLGLFVAEKAGHTGPAFGMTLLALVLGAATLAAAVRPSRRPEDRFLLAWLLLGLIFLLQLRFVAARYWVPFMAPVILLSLPAAGARLRVLACVLTPVLALCLARSDLALAQGHVELAARMGPQGPGLVAGHWGWQHHMEAQGWIALEEDAPVPPGTHLASTLDTWSQEPGPSCLRLVDRAVAAPAPVGPTVHSRVGAANFHANWISGHPPLAVYAPWAPSWGSSDEAVLMVGCAD
jgi:hypothetical protein